MLAIVDKLVQILVGGHRRPLAGRPRAYLPLAKRAGRLLSSPLDRPDAPFGAAPSRIPDARSEPPNGHERKPRLG